MSNSATKNPNKLKIKQLLAAVGIESEEDTRSNIDAYDYNWTRPHYFNSGELKDLENFTKKLSLICSRKFTKIYHSEFNVTISSTTQYFADEFAISAKTRSDHYLPFTTGEGEPCGFVGVPTKTAIIWATQLLGDSESPDDIDRELSQLEISLLCDTASSIIEALCDSSDSCNFLPGTEIVTGRLPVEFQATEEVCKIGLSAKKADSKEPTEAYLLMLCDKLHPIVGNRTQAQDITEEDVADAMLSHVHEMPISVKAQLDSTAFSIEEAMNIGVGDILLLEKKVSDPIEVIVEDRILFRGRPAKCAGKYAVVITEVAYDTK